MGRQTKWHGENVSELHWQFILARVDTTDPGRCWTWTRSLDTSGYAQMKANGVNVGAHRVSWAYRNGPIPAGLVIDHLCRNRACLNPAHLEPVENTINVVDRGNSPIAINARKTHCIHGHEFNEETTRYRVDDRGVAYRSCKKCANQRRAERRRLIRQGAA